MDACAASAAVASAAEGCINPELWSDMAVHVARALGADTASFGLLGAAGDCIMRHCPWTDPDLHLRYDADMHAMNYIWSAAARGCAGQVITEAIAGGRDRYLRSGIFNEFIRPQGMDSIMTLNLTGRGRPFLGLVTVGRRPSREAFGREDMAAAEVLCLALSRTMAATGMARSFYPSPPQGDIATILVTPGLRMLDRSARLEPLLCSGDVSIANGILSIPGLAGLEAAVLAAGRNLRDWPPPVASALGPVASAVGPLRVEISPGGQRAPGAVRLRFIAADEGSIPEAIRHRYGLTGRETEIAMMIAEGLALPDVADRLCIGLTTARTHLQRLFDKTGTRSQLALALLLSRECAKEAVLHREPE